MQKALHSIDFYKAGHIFQYPKNTSQVYSNFTPRNFKYLNVHKDYFDEKVVFFGLQYYIKETLIKNWNSTFFTQPKEKVCSEYKKLISDALFCDFDVSHIEDLHDLGYLPISIKALPEGSRVNKGIPVLTIKNTKDEFFWITNYLETSMSADLWKLMVNATVAFNYRSMFNYWNNETAEQDDFFTSIQGHDFSFRGMSGSNDASISGMAHLTSFIGTDCVGSIDSINEYYPPKTDNIIGCSVPATEHSVMCMGGEDSEYNTIKRLITEVYPSGIVSIVSDTWDFFNVISNTALKLKDVIESRDGKVVFRPDSGDPVKIICGDPESNDELVRLGAVRVLESVFGSTKNSKGYKELNECIGLIYGDSITPDRANTILKTLKEMGFASSCCVFGIGSYTYNYSTRDSIGAAMKATCGIVDGEVRHIFKNPKTDSGLKKSAKGYLRVELENSDYVLYDGQMNDEGGELKEVFNSGKLLKEYSIEEIRNNLK